MALRNHPLKALLLLLAAILAVAGCTGGGDTSLPAGTGAGSTTNNLVVRLDFVSNRGEASPRVITDGDTFRVQVLDPTTLVDILPAWEVARIQGATSQDITLTGVPQGTWIVRVTVLKDGVVVATAEDVPVTVGIGQAALVTIDQVTCLLTNPSFETGDYTAWTLFSRFEPVGNGRVDGNSKYSGAVQTEQAETNGIVMGIVTDGTILSAGDTVFDFFKGVDEQVSSINMPITYTATDGTYSQFFAQSGPSSYRMNQTVTVPADTPFIAWDMMYFNAAGVFVPDQQEIKLLVRNAETDAILAVVFQTVEGGDPYQVPTMTTFFADLTPWSGQTIKLDFTQANTLFYFDVATDNWRWTTN